MLKKQILIECASALLIMLFLYASVSKFLDFQTFIGEINNQPLPNSWTPFLVWFIPCSEIAISVALMFEFTRLIAFWAVLFLMGVFTLYSVLILTHVFAYVPCSCGGVIRRLSWKQHLILNLFFVGLSILGIKLQGKKSSPRLFINNKNSLV